MVEWLRGWILPLLLSPAHQFREATDWKICSEPLIRFWVLLSHSQNFQWVR